MKQTLGVARLLITCPDRSGIVAKVTTFLQAQGANITDLDQHATDPQGGTFFMRLEFQTDRLKLTAKALEQRFTDEIAKAFSMDWQIHYTEKAKRMAIFVSKYDHALLEILWRWSRQELAFTIPLIISNHPDLKEAAQHFDLPFYCLPVTPKTKLSVQEKMLDLCDEMKVEGIILARYMQILTNAFVKHYANQIINIHHSFLPAFVGANPYQQAYDKGVKLIGATAHYVTEELDMGPIIAQDVVRVSHRLNVSQLRELGQYVERMTLARAVKAHVEDRIIVDGNKTIVFDLQ